MSHEEWSARSSITDETVFQWVLVRLRHPVLHQFRFGKPRAIDGLGSPALGANLDPLSLGCVHDDVLAIVPRWTAHVLAGTHQSIGDCSLDHRSCAFDPVFAGAYTGAFIEYAYGIAIFAISKPNEDS